MRRLLWVGDAGVSSGFARITHEVLDVLRETWDIVVLGINYTGDPHPFPYPIYPCDRTTDSMGVHRTADMVTGFKPDLVIVQQDPWNVPFYVRSVGDVPLIAAMAVDGKNCAHARQLNGVAHAVFWTAFGLQEARLGGYAGGATVIPLGVDLTKYKPLDRRRCRTILDLPEKCLDAFIVGNVNRNQPRKRLDLTIAYFAQWMRDCNARDAYLYVHVSPTGDVGVDCLQLMQYFGLSSRLIRAEPEVIHGVSEGAMVATYNAFDVQVTTTQGEGWGLTQMEGMACGIPQIVPQWAALAEWCGAAAMQVPCSEIAVTPGGPNAIGGIADRDDFIAALDSLYRDEALRHHYRRASEDLVAQPQYRWRAIGEQYARMIDDVLAQRVRPLTLAAAG